MDFNKEEVEKLIIDVKAKVFGDALDRNLSTKDAVEEVQKVEKETREFLEKEEVKETVKELKKINKKLKKVEEKQKKLEEETPELKTVAEGLPENNNTIDSKKVSEYKKLQEQKEELTREGLFAEQFVYELTEDYADKHGWREEVKESLQQWFGKLSGFVSNVFGKITGEEAEAMAIAKPFAKIALKAGAKSKAGKEFIKFLVKELLKQGVSQTKINEIMTKLGADPVDSKANTESFEEYDDVSTGVFERSSKKSSTSTSSRSTMNSGGGSAMPPDPEKEPDKDKGGTDFTDVTKSDNGRPQVTIEVKEAELKGFGVRRKIERMTADSKIGQNVVSEPHRDPKVTSDFRRGAERYLKSEGKSPKALKKVDVDHMQELQSGGSDTRANLHFLDRSFNRSIGKKINHATKDMPKGTKYEIKFKVKETGENL